MSIPLSGGERLIIEGLQQGKVLKAHFAIAPAFVELGNDIAAIGDALSLEHFELIVRVPELSDQNTVVFELTQAGKDWVVPVPTPTPTPIPFKPKTVWDKYKLPILMAAALLLILVVSLLVARS